MPRNLKVPKNTDVQIHMRNGYFATRNVTLNWVLVTVRKKENVRQVVKRNLRQTDGQSNL